MLGLTGREAEEALGKAGITVNKNAIPYDPNPPMVTSGIRIGTPAVTSRGMQEEEMDVIGDLITQLLDPTAPPGMFDILADSINIMQAQIARSRLKSEKPEVILTPDVGHVGILEFHCAEDAIEAGRACALDSRAALEEGLGL